MPTFQFWLSDYDVEKLEAIRRSLARERNPDHVDEDEMEQYVNEGIVLGRRRRPKLNVSYVVRAAIEDYNLNGGEV